MLPEDYEYYPEIKVKDKITIKSKRIFDDLEYRDKVIKNAGSETWTKFGKGFWVDLVYDNGNELNDKHFILLRELEPK